MNPSAMTAETISPLFEELTDIALASLHACKSARAEAERLQAELDTKDKVILEKIANEARPALDAQLIDDTVRQLEAFGFVDADSRVKIASELRKDPNQALVLVGRLMEISTPMPDEGKGVPKQANTETPGIPAHLRNKYSKDYLESGLYRIIEEGA